MDENLPKFFHQYRIGKKESKKKLPKRNTVEAIRSHLKCYIQRNNNVDISIETDFPKFSLFWKGYIKSLKAKGLGDTKHNPELPKETLVKINDMLVLLHEAMIGNAFLMDETKNPPKKIPNPSYAEILEKITKLYDKKGKDDFFLKRRCFRNKNIANYL